MNKFKDHIIMAAVLVALGLTRLVSTRETRTLNSGGSDAASSRVIVSASL
jgi:hypothetical protein